MEWEKRVGEFVSELTKKTQGGVGAAAAPGFRPARGRRREGRVVERELWSRPFRGIRDLLLSLPGAPGPQSQTLGVH